MRLKVLLTLLLLNILVGFCTAQSSRTNRSARIAIVGGGMAGLSAAAALQTHGFDHVEIFEVGERIGGRVHSIAHSDGFLEMGADFIQSKHNNPIYDYYLGNNLLAPANIQRHYEQEDIEYYSPTGCRISNSVVKQFESWYERTKARINNGMERNNFDKRFSVGRLYQDALLNLLRNPGQIHASPLQLEELFKVIGEYEFCSNNSCATWTEVSQNSWKKNLDDTNIWLDKRGFNHFLDEMRLKIRDTVKIHFKTKVVKIDAIGDSVELSFKRGARGQIEKQNFDHVIVTVPLGVLKNDRFLITQMSERKLNAIDSIGFGTIGKMFFIFDRELFPKTANHFDLLYNEECVKADARNDLFRLFTVHPWFRNVLLIWVVGTKNNVLMETMSTHQLMSIGMRNLRNFVNSSFPDPVRIHRTMWSTDEAFLGSFSYYTPLSEYMNVDVHDIASPIFVGDKPRILFAGEATHGTHFSSVQGAYESGIREADRLRDAYSGGKFTRQPFPSVRPCIGLRCGAIVVKPSSDAASNLAQYTNSLCFLAASIVVTIWNL